MIRPKTFVGPERLGVFEILFDWIREGRRIPILGDGSNRYQLLAVEDLVDATVSAASSSTSPARRFNVGAAEFGTVRDDLEGLIAHAGLRLAGCSRSRRARPSSASARSSSRGSHRSPSGTTAPRTATRTSTISKAQRLLGYKPRLSNEQALCETYDWYLAHREELRAAGVTHRVPWDQQALGLLKRLA